MKPFLIPTKCKYCSKAYLARRDYLKMFRCHFCSRICKQTYQQVHAIPPNKRFWRHVKKSSTCWIWTGGISAGYGAFGLTPHKQIKAHRFAYNQSKGIIPDGLLVCHKCDVRLCVRPSHLFLGTHKDNLQDASRKHRLAVGEKNKSARLTDKDIRFIRENWKPYKVSHHALAKQFGVHDTTIQSIIYRKTWKHLP